MIFISQSSLLIDGTIKAYRKGGFPRKWPNVVCSDIETITSIDQKWESLDLGLLYLLLQLKTWNYAEMDNDEIIIN